MRRFHGLAWGWVMLAACGESHEESDAALSDAGAMGCDYGGKRYDVGASFPSTDGCNTCSCSSGGMVACTEKACIDAGADAGSDAGLRWFKTCGAPVCGPSFDAPTGQPRCTTEKVGDACKSSGTMCDPSLGCAVNLICDASDPTLRPGGCPISRARFKEGIRYLDRRELTEIASRLLQTPLAEWRYKGDLSQRPQMGFIIEDVEPSPSVEGDQVNLYGYASMAVAALQVQGQELRSMHEELATLRARLAELERLCPTSRASSQRRSAR